MARSYGLCISQGHNIKAGTKIETKSNAGAQPKPLWSEKCREYQAMEDECLLSRKKERATYQTTPGIGTAPTWTR